MNSPADASGPERATAISRNLPGPPFLRHYPAYELVTWQPEGTLDDAILDQIAEWLVISERVLLPFKRFVDLSELATVAIRTRHLFEFAGRRAKEFGGAEPVRAALFSDDWVGFGIARLYETLMEGTAIEVRAFRDRVHAAEWLVVPADILTLKDDPRLTPRPRLATTLE